MSYLEHEARPAARARRGHARSTHAVIPHTADAGFTAGAATLPELFGEAATALAEMTADVEPGGEPGTWVEIDVNATDLEALAFAWLNALIADGEIARGALVATTGLELTGPGPGGGTWRLRARAGFRGYGLPGVSIRRPPKSATFHRLAVHPAPGGWTMVAYLDM